MTLAETLAPQSPPLRLCNGVLLIGRTRVPIDTVIHAYDRGETPEEIALNFDSLRLPEIYAALSYYLEHPAEMSVYFEERRRRSEEVRQRMKPLLPSRDLRDRLTVSQRSKP